MIMGDVNFRLDRSAEASSVKFINLLNTFELLQNVTEPTHDDGGLLDVIITRVDERFERPCVVDIGLSDYRLVKGSISITPSLPIYETVSSRSWRSFDTNIFRLDVMSTSLNPLVDRTNVSPSDLVEQHNTVLVNLLDKHAPLTTSRRRVRRSDCFFDEDCRAKKKTMRRADRRFKSGRQGAILEEWKSAQSDYRRNVDRKRSDYWREKIESEKNPLRLWQSIQKVCGNNGQKLDTDLTPILSH